MDKSNFAKQNNKEKLLWFYQKVLWQWYHQNVFDWQHICYVWWVCLQTDSRHSYIYNILYFLWLYNEFFIILYNILKIAELDCCQIIICTTYTRLYTSLTSIPRFALREKVTLQLLKLLLKGVDVVGWSMALDVRLSEWCCSVSMVWVQIPSREEQKFDSSKI